MKNFLDDRDKLMEILKKIDKLRNEGRLKIALLALEGLMPEYPDLPEVLNLMAEIKYQMGHKEDARNIFLEILEKFPDYSRALNNLGVIYFNDHYTEKALYYFKKSLKINPDDSSTVLNLGDLLISLEKYEETRDLYTGYLERNKNDREIRKRLEMLYDRLIPLHTDNVNKPFFMKEREYWNVNDIYEAMFKRVVTDENIDKMTFEERMKAWDSSAISSSNRIIQGLPVKPEWKILEIGCGVGRVIKPLRAKFAHVDGVDIAENMIEFARQYLADCSHNGNVYVNSGSDLGMFSDNTYDLVYSMIVFQHIRSISVVRNYFNEIFRVLKPGGYFRLQVHQWESNFGKYDDEALPDRQYALDGNGYTPEQLNLLFSEQQFNEIDIIREGKWLWATAKKSADILDSFTVSAIVSTYNSEMFIRGCLEDLVEQTLYRKGQMEIIIVDTGSEQKEGAIVREFQDKYGRNNIRYIRTEDRKTLYEAWNTGIKEARGKYITNANTDDRHRFDALEIMSDYLDRNQDIALVYADQLITTIPNETFSDTKANLRWNWPEFSYEELETRCIIGPQPVWRKELHNKYGYFRGDFKSAGDYEFWLRIGKYEKIRLIPELLGLYYENRQGLERASYASDKETDLVRTEYGMKKRGIPAKATIPASVSSDDLANCKKNVFIDKHLVSVIIPSYNHGCYLYESVESVVNQTYSNIEIIIINDGSSDDTKVIANALMSEHKNIRFFDREHEGIVNTRNFGLFVSSGKYILFLDGDDKIHPDFLKETVAILDSKPSVGFVYTAVQHIGIRTDIWSGGEFNPQKFLRENQLTCTALFRREIFEQTGGMKPVMEDGYEDWEFWISAYEKGWHGYLLDKPYFYYRKINNISRLGKLYQNQLLENVLKARIINLHRELYSPSELDWAKDILNKIEKPSINKVLIIHHNKTSFSPDGIHSGAEMATIHLARALVLLGLDVKVYAVLTEEPGLYDGVDYRHYASNEELSAIINSLSEPVDLMLTLSVEVLTYTRGKKHIKTRAYWMQNPANSYTDNVEILNNTDLIVYVSHHQMECAEKIGIMTKGIVLYNGFFEHIFHPSSLNYNPYQITYAGAIVPQKGVHILINAFPLIQKEFPEARLFICGTSAFWGHKSYIDIEHIEKTNHSIKFLGAVSQKDLAIIFQQSAIGVIPTDKKIWEDPFPLTSIEMQACGCPVVVSRAGGLPEGILEHETGFIVDSDNPADWSDRIISLLKDRPGLENMREKAYHSVYNRFRWTKLAKNLLELVKDVTSVNIEPEESINKAIIHDRSTVICEKIAFLSTYNQACGIATHTGFIYDALKKELKRYPQYDGEIIILAQKDVKLVTEDEPNVIRCWKKGTSDSKENFHHLIHVIKEKKITILHIQFQDGLLADTDIVNLVNICRNMNIKVFITFHSSEVALPLCAELINASNCSFVHLEQSLMRFVMAGANPELIRIVPHGVIDDLQSALSLNEARVKAGISSELKVISSFGFLDPHKGVLEIIRALPEILKKHNVIFIFIGGGHPNNPERDVYPKKCKEEAIHSGISERVYFVEGFLPQETVSLYLSASDVIVMNYTINRNEASGAAAFALAHRRPLITNSMPPFKPLVNCTLQTS